MKRKALSLLLILAMILTLVVGCSKTSDADKDTGKVSDTTGKTTDGEELDPVTLQMTVFGSENDEAVYRERLDLAQAMYEHITIDLLYIPTDYSTKLQAMIAGGTAPDIMQLSEDVHAYSALGQIISLDELVSTSGTDLDAKFGTAYETYKYNGSLYAMPDRGGCMIVYYNKDLFDAAGVSYPSKDWTWDDMLSAAKKLTVKNGDEVETYGFAAGSWWPWWMSFMYQNGARILDENNNVVIDSPEAVEALKFYNDLVYEHKVAPSPEDFANLGDVGPDQLFAQGKVAFEITGFWNIGSLNNVPDINWDIAPLWKKAEGGTVAFGSGLAISKDCEYPEEAYKVLEFLTSVDGQMPIVTNKQDAPANKELLSSDAFLKAEFSTKPIYMETFAESADSIMNLPLGPYWNELTKVCDDNLSELFSNSKDAETIVKEMQTDLEDVMSQYQK